MPRGRRSPAPLLRVTGVIAMMKQALLISLLATMGAGAMAAPLTDNFDFPQAIAQDYSNGTASFSATASSFDASIIGGQREIYVNAATGADALNGTRAGVSSSRFSFANDAGVAGFGILRWDGSSVMGFNPAQADFGIDRTGFAGVNFAAVADSLKLTFHRSDAAYPFTLQFFSGANDWTSFTFSAIPVCAAADASCLSQSGAVTGPTDFYFNFALMNLLGTKSGAGANFANITALQAIFNFNVATGSVGSAEGVDFAMDFQTVVPAQVPEPGTMTMALLGAAGLLLAWRRRAGQ
ncbi:PEP-CTERM sorting domain-containing protein [Roseateles violae]|uniref:PEP-CTERM sorting domain-containing protein n=1 Tax=Roseateles violae TaxID=3058042 RepID=A0ABT8DSB9_9BURK|nr:PEP-CTERM sorting domain-containing protein [Pelomonas sp. PFR6]MDN3921220.1 PEP-CTERM sorting domain-containing protein [Pelomonas sp. PFR6]